MFDIILWNLIFWSVWIIISLLPYWFIQRLIDNHTENHEHYDMDVKKQ